MPIDGAQIKNPELAAAFLKAKGNGSADDQQTPGPDIRPLTAAEFLRLELPPRQKIVAPWLPEKGLAMIYSPRGVGKTLLGMTSAYAIAAGADFLGFKTEKPRKVPYIDGEMPAETMQERLAVIVAVALSSASWSPYDKQRNLTCGPDSELTACLAHVHAGHATETRRVFVCRGGTLISSLRIWPAVTASRCSAIASMCQPCVYGVKPPPGYAVAYVDWSQQEFGIAAALSGDMAMQAAYHSGDPYLAFAKQAHAVPDDATKATHGPTRELFKQCVLATQYGMEAEALALRTGQPPVVARDLLRAHRETYRTFWRWSDASVNVAMLRGIIWTAFGWPLRIGAESNPRSLRNFPMQGNGAEMLRIACCLATERGIEVCAPVHDAVLIMASIDAGACRAASGPPPSMEESTMNNIHATTLRTNSHRVEARMEAAAAIWFAMKWRGLTLHLEYTEHGPRWSLSDGQRVPDSADGDRIHRCDRRRRHASHRHAVGNVEICRRL